MSNLSRFLKQHFLLVALALAILLVIGWYGVRVGIALYEINETFNVTLAEDVRTREYLGEVISENRDPQTKKVVSYRIRRNDGSVIERSAESVRAFEP